MKPLLDTPPKDILERHALLRAKIFRDVLTAAEQEEYHLLEKAMDAWRRQTPSNRKRELYDKANLEKLREWEEHAENVRLQAEYLMGLRKDRPRPRSQPFSMRLSKR